MRLYSLLVVVLCLLGDSVGQDDVPVVCGGYIKSQFKADFTKIKIILYSVDGTRKYTTDCAANNGYFLLPIYDQGSYVVKPISPDGWMTAPTEVALVIKDGSDPCSSGQDILFELLGFQLQGQVTSGGNTAGPSGVEVRLSPTGTAAEDGPIVRHVNTGTDGRFVLDGVFPGTYRLTASHPLWKLSEQSVEVVIEDDSVTARPGLVVLGYDVKGVVRSGGEPVQGVLIFLHLQPGQPDLHVNCSNDEVESSRNPALHQSPPLCSTSSDEGGTFIFHPLPPASYLIVPYYQQDQLQFEVHPTELKFTVSNDSVLLSPPFEVQGFSVTGQVVSTRQESPVPGARVYLGDHHSTVTNAEGRYSLLNVTSGTYLLKVEAARLQFETREVHISPSSPTLSPMAPDKYLVCGDVLETVPTSASGKLARRVEVTTSDSDPHFVAMATTSIESGEFCLFLPLGEYVMKVVVTAADAGRGLLILPDKQLVPMLDTPIMDKIKFSQSLAHVYGTVECIEDCPKALSVKLLRSSDMKQELVAQVTIIGKEAKFELRGVLQGRVKVGLNYAAWCWNASELELDIERGNPQPVHLVHTGYNMQFKVSHDTLISYHLMNSASTELVLSGEGSICLDEPGIYSIYPQSCHKFENAPFSFNTASPKPLLLQSAGHTLQIVVMCEVSDATLSIMMRFKDGTTEISPEKTEQVEGGVYRYHFSSTARADEEVDIEPLSSLLMFSPSSLRWAVGHDCPEVVPSFLGSMGEVILGKVEPALAGVAVNLVFEEAGQITTHTDERGEYRVGPFREGSHRSTSVEFPGYTFERLPGSWTFRAVKLCRVDIRVGVAGGRPLAKVLVSVNGDSFRQNAFTDEEGVITYHNMAPGQYFIKPFLREFEFSPSSHVVSVTQGRDEALTFSGRRVAFSCSGRVSTLNRRPVAGAIVQVSGEGLGEGCTSHNQLATTDDGYYRLLGLLPGCQYNLSVEESENISHVLPPYRPLIVNEKDVESSDFLVVLHSKTLHISGWVNTDPKFIASLKAAVSIQSSRESPLHVVPVGSVGFFDFPALPLLAKGERGYVVSLTSNLASNSYRFSRVERTVSGVDDSHIILQFSAEEVLATTENQSKGSVLALALVIAAAFALVNFEIVWASLRPYLSRTFSAFTAGSRKSAQKTRK